MDDHRRSAWAALGIGPVWLLRDPPAADGIAGTGAGDAVTVVPREADAAPDSDAPEVGQALDLARSPAAPSALREAVIARLPWTALSEAVSECRACGLSDGRRNTVFGAGPLPAPWLLVGEAPGQPEGLSGEPLDGDAYRLLEQMLHAIGVDLPGEAFIANVVKCRPPGNRDPLPEEAARCEPYLLRQVELLQPRLIVALGRAAAQSLLRIDATVVTLRGRVHAYQAGGRAVPTVVTYHPPDLLRNLPDKASVWADLRLARRTFDSQV